MRSRGSHLLKILIVLFTLLSLQSHAQSSEQKALEARRERLQKEIAEMNRLLTVQKKKKGNIVDQLESLDRKIVVSQQLIRVTNQESNLLSRQVNANIRKISKLREDLEVLKEDYARMIRRSYQSRAKQNRLMFLLSAESFFQAFKRLQYMKQYTQFRKEQGEAIVAKTEELAELNKSLAEQRKAKDALVAENQKVKNQLMKEIGEQKALLKTIRQNESKYAATIEAKQKEARKIDQQIERLIRSAIVTANREAGKSSGDNSKFVLTPEAELVANSFSANKGKLIWPVEKGIKRQGFGVYKDAVYPGIKHQSNGVIIATDEGARARAVFQGEVIAILAVPGGNKGVQIKHGNYISTYYNLSNLYVKKGDKVAAKEELGEIFTNRASGLTQLKFYLYRDATRLNPEEWIYRL
ncbi:peptidoglycan DD-metalloendopeptidase family protein [Zeaxanthinibacter sp. PT1]|uniref:murein hydrolase activator EnvC family protein n=1 Tax=Zeaxanthinibacter TaxID=561554 RepID=UPI0023496144|nr:peptidoglycan DD-metalloendopeptidase family protein [Zeaxanthinibacter sp. PT1]MDC6350567.1 peptidoglycan DD-metalloendopeptidase family protein [Zeaxanthinibacter sp. PT1]